MANINDVLTALTTLNTAVDTLITNIQNLPKGEDSQPAIDKITEITSKIQAIQLPQ